MTCRVKIIIFRVNLRCNLVVHQRVLGILIKSRYLFFPVIGRFSCSLLNRLVDHFWLIFLLGYQNILIQLLDFIISHVFILVIGFNSKTNSIDAAIQYIIFYF